MRSMTFYDCLVRTTALYLLSSHSHTNAKIHSIDIVMQITSTTPCFISERCPVISIQFGQCEGTEPFVHEGTSVRFGASSRLLQKFEKLAMEAIRDSDGNGSLWNEANMNGVNILGSLDKCYQKPFQHVWYAFFTFLVLGLIAGLIYAAALVGSLKPGASPLQSLFDKKERIAPLKYKKVDHSLIFTSDEMIAKRRKSHINSAQSTLCICGKEDRMTVERVLVLLKTELLDKVLTDKKIAKLEQEIRRLLSETLLSTLSAINSPERRPRLLTRRQEKCGYVVDNIFRGHRNENLHLEITTDDIGADTATIEKPSMSPISSAICDEIGQNDSEYLTAMTDIKQKLAEELADVSLLLPSSLSESVKSMSFRTTRSNSQCSRDSNSQYGPDSEREEGAFQSVIKNTDSLGSDNSSFARRSFF